MPRLNYIRKVLGVMLAITYNFITDEASKLSPENKSGIIWANIYIVGSKTYVIPFHNPKTSNKHYK